jgi:hypothetical protein
VVGSSWRPGDELSPLWQAFDAWFDLEGLAPAPSRCPADLAINTVASLRAALIEVGGFRSVEVTRERPPIRFPSLADFWEWRVSFPATFQALAAVDPTRLATMRAECVALLEPIIAGGEVCADQDVLFAMARP